MKFLILLAVASVAVADVSHLVKSDSDDKSAQIISQDLEISPDGHFSYAFANNNGIASSKHGHVNNPESENPSLFSEGKDQWISPEGQQIILNYVADENGYQPQGEHLPTPPPIPEPIQRLLKYLAAHPPPPARN